MQSILGGERRKGAIRYIRRYESYDFSEYSSSTKGARTHPRRSCEPTERCKADRCQWESGESLPDLENAYALAKLLGVSVDDLIAHNEAATGYPIPPRGKHIFGIMRMGERGQIVIPKKARDIFDLHAGSELLILGDEARGIALQKVEDAESMLESYGRIVNERRADGPTTNS